ncbi:MAG TPA: anhydro-N-acetylmuramic acid kinase [Acidobacteriaceae bacterium]|nr:anhydro-N-acetylmuramic acid kinase [Acidobacteriaceae bacterium]
MTTASARKAFRGMTVAGMMSGTSADGIDVAIVQIRTRQNDLAIKLLGHCGFPFSPALRQAVLRAMDAQSISTAELARLNWRLGQAYAEALAKTLKKTPCRLDLIGCHGQTIYHQPRGERYAGRMVACTWQIGEMAMLAASSGVPVVSNFRPADMVAGGQGAPLVPLLDYVLFHHPLRGRVLQNLGGIGNLTALFPKAAFGDVLAFDTGPGNMVIDQLMQTLFARRLDQGGETAQRGGVLGSVVDSMLRERFFHQPPPKSAGREQFGTAYAERFLAACRGAGGSAEDAIASATALTARSVRAAYAAHVRRRMRGAPVDFVVSGGGSRNRTLMRMLRQELEPLGCTVKASDEMGLPAEAKEAAAFALLACQTWLRRPGNVPAATGAAHPAILGQITDCAPRPVRRTPRPRTR